MRVVFCEVFAALTFGLNAMPVCAGDWPFKSGDPVHLVALPATETLTKIDSGCQRAGETVIAWDSRSILCEIPLDWKERVAARFALHAPFTPSPRAFVRFRVETSQQGQSLVHAEGWLEDGKPVENGRSVSLSGARFAREMDDFFSGL